MYGERKVIACSDEKNITEVNVKSPLLKGLFPWIGKSFTPAFV
jgi:hypothetical protein